MSATITIHGGLASAPELRFTQSGVAIASGTVASTERYKDRDGNWQDGKKLYVRYSAFKDLAESIAGSGLDKGARVIVTGKLHTREYEDRDGVKRSSTELEVTDFGVSLRGATVTVTRNASQGGAGRAQGAVQGDGWATTPPGSSSGVYEVPSGWSGGDDQSTPF